MLHLFYLACILTGGALLFCAGIAHGRATCPKRRIWSKLCDELRNARDTEAMQAEQIKHLAARLDSREYKILKLSRQVVELQAEVTVLSMSVDAPPNFY